MGIRQHPFWRAAFLVLIGLVAAAGLTQAQPIQVDPPAQVARLARLTGAITTRAPGEDRWRLARANLPLVPGDTIWVEPGGQAVLDLAASRIGVAGGTELRLNALDGPVWEASLIQGELHVRLLHLPAGVLMRIHMPRGVLTLSGDARVALSAGDRGRPMVVNVLEGAAQLQVQGRSTDLGPNEAATVTGDGPFVVTPLPAQVNVFAVAMMARDARFDPMTPEIVRQMTGAGDLALHGSWRNTRDFGAVWEPRVETGWAPYRNGVWAWVEPWGWSWVDDAPWGFAPFHYGRWQQIDGRWAWVPAALHAGVGFRPAYAPALVNFLGVRRQPGQTVAPVRGPMSAIGWVPLAPGEALVPWFSASDAMTQRFNVSHVRNMGAGAAALALAQMRNHAAATLVPAAAMLASHPMQQARSRLPALPETELEVLQGTDIPGPSLTSWGMTPRLARRLGLLSGEPQRLYTFPTLRPAGAGSLRQPGAAPGPGFSPVYPGLRHAPAPGLPRPGAR